MAGRVPEQEGKDATMKIKDVRVHVLEAELREPFSWSLGWARTRTPDETEQALYRFAEPRWWPYINLYLVTWGQNVCRPVYPRCGDCVLHDICPRHEVAQVGR